MNKKGFTLVEVIVSIGLIAIVLLLLFQLLLDIQYEANHSSFAKKNQLNRATVIERIQNDLMGKTVVSVSTSTSGEMKVITINLVGEVKTIQVSENSIIYQGESWTIESEDDETTFDLNNIEATLWEKDPSDVSKNMCSYITNLDINGDGVCDTNCEVTVNGSIEIQYKNETYRSCPSYKLLRIRIPVVVSGMEENIIDDFEIFYIGD